MPYPTFNVEVVDHSGYTHSFSTNDAREAADWLFRLVVSVPLAQNLNTGALGIRAINIWPTDVRSFEEWYKSLTPLGTGR